MHKIKATVNGYGPGSGYDDDVNEIIVYDTVEELLSEPIAYAWMDDNNYYLMHKSDGDTGWSDCGMYTVNKKTKKVDRGEYLNFMLNVEDKTVPLDVSKLKELLN